MSNTQLLTKLNAAPQTLYQFAGTEVPDPISMILALPVAEEREMAVRAWVRNEFNLPRSIRALCDQCFLRVLTHATFMHGADIKARTIQLGERRYELYLQSSEAVLATAPLVGVSFRMYEGELFAIAHVWAAKQLNGKGF
jgi:hypothetical protein